MNDQSFEPGPLADVECTSTESRSTLIFVRHLRHSPAKVWAALTDPAQLRQWAPYAPDRDLGRVGDVTLTMIDSQDTSSASNVSRCERPTLLEYTWGDDTLRWQLEPTDTGTRLTLHHTTGERGKIPSYAAGWHICLAVAERLLDGHPIRPIVGADAIDNGWQQLHDAYAEVLSIDAAGVD